MIAQWGLTVSHCHLRSPGSISQLWWSISRDYPWLMPVALYMGLGPKVITTAETVVNSLVATLKKEIFSISRWSWDTYGSTRLMPLWWAKKTTPDLILTWFVVTTIARIINSIVEYLWFNLSTASSSYRLKMWTTWLIGSTASNRIDIAACSYRTSLGGIWQVCNKGK